MTTRTDLKPGDVVRHPQLGDGLASRVKGSSDAPETVIVYHDPHAWYRVATDLAGWERVEVVKPGHVQVKVDDLDLSRWVNRDEAGTPYGRLWKLAIRTAKALAAQTSPGVELPVRLSHPEPAERGAKATFTFHDGRGSWRLLRVEEGWGRVWHTQFGDLRSWDALTDMDGEIGSLTLGWDDEDGLTITHRFMAGPERVKLAQPDEPTEFGARVTVATPAGSTEKWVRADGLEFPWLADPKTGVLWEDWRGLTRRGRVSLGWDD